MQFTINKLDDILKLHLKWLNNEEGGECADLSGANLMNLNLAGVNLSKARLQSANLSGTTMNRANLDGAYLATANLSGANLFQASLVGANLIFANLEAANLRSANLRGADIDSANLRGAGLQDAKYVPELAIAQTSILPDGDIVGWKKLRGGRICKLRIPAEAKRSNATGRKCRAEYAEVLEISAGGRQMSRGTSLHRPNFEYRVGEIVRPDSFSDDRWVECGPGIHFFITRAEAESYFV